MNGENLFNAATVMYKTGEEIEAMLEKLLTLLEQKLKEVKGIRKVEFIHYDSDGLSEWVTRDLIHIYGIYGNRAKKPSAYLSIQIKLSDAKEEVIVGPQPLLYVIFSVKEEYELNEFLIHQAASDGFELEGGCLWQLYEENEDRSQQRSWEKTECAYVVPLTDINESDDLDALIVDPIHSLMTSGLNSKKMDQRILRFRVEDSEVTLQS